MSRLSYRRRLVVGILVLVIAGLAAGRGALARVHRAPTVAECARLASTTPTFRHSLAAETVFCLRPSSIRTAATVQWTTCPSTPIEQPCEEGMISVTFRSTAAGFTSDPGGGPDSWGGEDFPGAGIYSLPGTGSYRCEGYTVDRRQGRTVYGKHTAALALRDQAAGFAAVGGKIMVATSVSPGQRSRLGRAAAVQLGEPQACVLSQLPIGPTGIRAGWPGKLVSVASLAGSSTTVSSSGTVAHSFPIVGGVASGATRMSYTVRWSSAVTAVPALKR